jgi:hypothetical protein
VSTSGTYWVKVKAVKSGYVDSALVGPDSAGFTAYHAGGGV